MKSHKINQNNILNFPLSLLSLHFTLLAVRNPFSNWIRQIVPCLPLRPTEQLIELLFPHDPLSTKCFHCKQLITTNCRPKTGLLSLLTSFSLSSVCCLFGCCFVPFIFSEFKGERSGEKRLRFKSFSKTF